MSDSTYSPWEMTKKWQKRWYEEQVFCPDLDSDKPKYYCFEYPPFPSGTLHMGHVRNYVIGDSLCRYKQLNGFNVLHVQGFDSMGIPVEDAAIKAGMTPVSWLTTCIHEMTKELMHLGLSYDHTRFISYHEPEYYQWTQWIFLKLYDVGLIYRAELWTGWCEGCNASIANELIENGRCWRCGCKINMKKLPQWFVNIKKIAPKLLSGLDAVQFPERAKKIQQNWIGQKEGVYISVQVDDSKHSLEFFTNRVELLYGMTFLAIAPENPVLGEIISGSLNEAKLQNTIKSMCMLPRIERLSASQDQGVFIDRYVVHPLTGDRIPIYAAPFVVNEFGTGVLFGCPAHVKNDFKFAKAMKIPITQVISSNESSPSIQDEPYLGEGVLMNSGPYDGKPMVEASDSILSELIDKGSARQGVTFSIKNWPISRQRYWSVPIPIVYCKKCGTIPVNESDLPVILPTDNVDLESSSNPLDHHAEFVQCNCPNCGETANRETSTLDTFMNNSWAYLKYCNTNYVNGIFDEKAVNDWMPCDIAIGGTEQITVGNFYYRVVLNLLHRIGITKHDEPWQDSLFHGLVMKDGRKMSKSLGNIVEPEKIIAKYGVDAVRFHILYTARPESDVNWTEDKMKECFSFLSRIWNIATEIHKSIGPFPSDDTSFYGEASHSHLQSVFQHHTSVATKNIISAYEEIELQRVCLNLIRFTERIEKFWIHTRTNLIPINIFLLCKALRSLFLMMNPIVPHISEELWELFGGRVMICQSDRLGSGKIKNLVR